MGRVNAVSQQPTHGLDEPLAYLAKQLQLPLAAYDADRLRRRLDHFLHIHGLKTFERLQKELPHNRKLAEELRQHLTIHVTSFFRDPSQWDQLAHLLRTEAPRERWHIWSCAASTGQEPLSIVALFHDLGLSGEILATDIDEATLDYARRGVYSTEQVGSLPEKTRRWLFESVEGNWRVRPSVHRLISYRQLDLLDGRYPEKQFDLILCRNVLIYFRATDRDRVVDRLTGHLRPNGILFLGASEVLPDPQVFGLTRIRPTMYKRADVNRKFNSPYPQ
jgi:chemotaxis protein methyltransferase CheR